MWPTCGCFLGADLCLLGQTSVSPPHKPCALCCRRQQGALEQAAVSAQRQADDLRSRLAGAQSKWQLAQAAADAAAQERSELMQQVAQELNRAPVVEQVRSWHRNSAAAC